MCVFFFFFVIIDCLNIKSKYVICEWYLFLIWCKYIEYFIVIVNWYIKWLIDVYYLKY